MEKKIQSLIQKMEFLEISEIIISVVLDPNFTIIHANQLFLKKLNTTLSYIKNLPFQSIIHSESLAKWLKFTKDFQENQNISQIVTLQISNNFTKRNLWFKLEFSFNMQKENILLVGSDISREMNKIREKKYLKTLYQKYIDSSGALMFLKDPKGIYTAVNTALCNLLKVTPKEIIGKTDFDVMSQNDASNCRESDLDAMKQEIVSTTIESIVGGDIFKMYKFPIFMQNKMIGLGSIGIDISMQLKLEKQLYKMIQENRAILNALPDLIFILDSNQIFKSYYVSSPNKFILPPSDFLNKKISEVLGEEMHNFSLNLMDETKKTGIVSVSQYKLNYFKKDEYYEARCCSIDENLFLFLIRDITKDHTKKLAMERDLEMAKEIQMSIMPSSNFLKNSPIQCETIYKPYSSVSGDIFDFFFLEKNYLRVIVVDAVGHGIQAALQTMVIQAELTRISHFKFPPSELLKILNHSIIEKKLTYNSFFSCFILDIDLDKNTITYSSAGHPEQYFRTENTKVILKNFGPVIGFLSDFEFKDESFSWEGDFDLFLFSDGLYDFFVDENSIFDPENLIQILEDQLTKKSNINQDNMNLQKSQDDFLQSIIDQVLTHSKNGQFMDDVVLIHLFN